MKHYHNKADLGDNDVSYLVVQEGQKLKLQFTKIAKGVDTDIEIFQGVKLWLNRCKLIIDNSLVDADRIIIWFTADKKKKTISNEHLHLFCDSEINIVVGKTTEENPNLGIFNVWTSDNRRCYEFVETSWIKERKQNNVRFFSARHGWAKENKSTLEFTITTTNL